MSIHKKRSLANSIPPPQSVSEATDAILQSIVGINAPEIDVTIYPDDIIRGYSVWHESTSNSPYGDHLGYNRAILRHITPHPKRRSTLQT